MAALGMVVFSGVTFCKGDTFSGARREILETGYRVLVESEGEEPGYGLYSYAIAVNNNNRLAIFLKDLFSLIPPVEDTAAQRSQTNVLYIPVKQDKAQAFGEVSRIQYENKDISVSHPKDFYDYKLARSLLDHLCDPPAEEIRGVRRRPI